MKRILETCLIAWLLFVMLTSVSAAAEYRAEANYFGAFATESQVGGSGCVSLDANNVRAGMPVNIVVLSTPQRLLTGKITSLSSAGCTRYFQSSESAAFYDVAITNGRFEPHELGVLVLPGVTLSRTRNGGLRAALGQKEFLFFECSSSEGIHVAVRSAADKTQVIWHDYIHVGIDVEPTCEKSDYQGFEALGKAFQRGR